MTERGVEFRVGAALVIAGIVLVVGILWLGGHRLAEDKYRLSILFSQVGGLVAGDRVTIAGLEAGEVVSLVFREGRVVTEVDVMGHMLIPTDSRISVASYGLIGAKHVSIQPGTSRVYVQPGEVLDGRYEKGLGEVVGEMGDALTEIRQILKEVDEALSDVEPRKNVKESLANANQASEQFKLAAADLRVMASALRKFVDDEVEPASDALRSVEDATTRFAEASERLSGVAASVDSILVKVEGGQGSLGKFINDPTAYDELLAAVREVRAVVQRINEDPKSVVKISLF